MKIHEKYMSRCLQLAQNAFPRVMPNPGVGAVLVVNDKIIAEGFTSAYGGAHAEVNAINQVKNDSLLKKATLYVSLEPCSHYGKTPPCSDLIIAKNIPKIVIGTVDLFAKVAGRGIEKLFKAGREVIVGVLEEECEWVNRRFFTFHAEKRPFIILKWAQTQDGFISPPAKNRDKNEPVWITSPIAQQYSHRLRASEQAILVGTNTALADNPSLTTRAWYGKNPTRVVLDRKAKIPSHYSLFDGKVRTLIFTEKEQENKENMEYISVNFNKDLPKQICNELYKRNIQSLIIEGGSQTLQSFIDTQLWDEAHVFTGNKRFIDGIKAPVFYEKSVKEMVILDDVLEVFKRD